MDNDIETVINCCSANYMTADFGKELFYYCCLGTNLFLGISERLQQPENAASEKG